MARVPGHHARVPRPGPRDELILGYPAIDGRPAGSVDETGPLVALYRPYMLDGAMVIVPHTHRDVCFLRQLSQALSILSNFTGSKTG